MILHPHRKTFLTTHHIVNRLHGGKSTPDNSLKLWRDRHNNFHFIFGNKSIDEIMYNMNFYHYHYHRTSAWKLLFGRLPLLEVVRLLERTMKIKRSLKKRKRG